jgi:hypothetical protein
VPSKRKRKKKKKKKGKRKRRRKCTHNVIVWRVRLTFVAMETQ